MDRPTTDSVPFALDRFVRRHGIPHRGRQIRLTIPSAHGCDKVIETHLTNHTQRHFEGIDTWHVLEFAGIEGKLHVWESEMYKHAEKTT